MKFDNFMKDASTFEINLSSYDPKNSYGSTFLSNIAIRELETAINTFGVDRVDLKSKDHISQAQALIEYKAILSKILEMSKESVKSLLTQDTEKIEVISLDYKEAIDLKVDNDKPMQIITDGVSSIVHLGKSITQDNNMEQPYYGLTITQRLDTESLKAQKARREALRTEFVFESGIYRGSFGDMKKAIESNNSLRELFINSPRFMDTPLGFSANLKKVNFGALPEIALTKLFGSSYKIKELEEQLNSFNSVLKNTNIAEMNIKNMPIEFIELSRLIDRLENISKILQLDSDAPKIFSDAVKVSATTQKTFEIANIDNATAEKLQQTAFNEPKLSHRITMDIKEKLDEEFASAPRVESRSIYLANSYHFKSESGQALGQELNQKEAPKVEQSASLDQNIKNLFENNNENGLKM